MKTRAGPLATLACSLLLIACGSPSVQAVASPPVAQTERVSGTAESYLRPAEGVTYIQMAPDVERELTTRIGGNAATSAFRDVALAGSTAKLRLVVIEMTDSYAATKPLNEVHGMGGPNTYPDKKPIQGVPTFLHTDVAPNFLAWQRGSDLILVYGTDHPAMERLADLLIVANR